MPKQSGNPLWDYFNDEDACKAVCNVHTST